ncbi:hypothetical protein ND861_18890 [Leptospira sp. 2 VSF19]|uniref:IraD/Gp25-like domain-containing protein n=1 Tax=Leptospira soteropolitanensis TaxID=2950025 RepID=A0AAW5VL92_9LEPT|nr:hypothetical protein [Leptospira soteropolitanensis]MCW7494733.1 hypothetical protein [Leptospira soteropolitanensis]MCW7502328.1 hypothetical protein [Leptospira soteropolitanensis]MCW7524561.1 hypothetical protein [Leptospira soteropolitanensis]MCW7528432.1 hypothetical protein [Leptospira soteropolitanensis]MCW7532296.1 hypothetical protein [Leptospira soteropolitanensis]
MKEFIDIDVFGRNIEHRGFDTIVNGIINGLLTEKGSKIMDPESGGLLEFLITDKNKCIQNIKNFINSAFSKYLNTNKIEIKDLQNSKYNLTLSIINLANNQEVLIILILIENDYYFKVIDHNFKQNLSEHT